MKKPINFGSYLHKYGGFSAFSVCKLFSSSDESLLAYSLGFITHYATDINFHPFVYATAGKSYLRHARIERAIDLFLAKTVPFSPSFPIVDIKKISKADKQTLFLLYATIAHACRLPALKKTDFFRAFSLFNAYLPRSSSLLNDKNTALINNLANTQNAEWSNPALPSRKSRDGAKELFDKAVKDSLQAINVFLRAIEEKTPLPFSVFGKNYLTGL